MNTNDTDIVTPIVCIGIDQSLSETAITVLYAPHNYSIHLFKGKGKNSLAKAIDIYTQLGIFLENLVNTPQSKSLSNPPSKPPQYLCFIEGGSYHSLGPLFSLGQLSGLIISILCTQKISYREIPPTLLKKFITGNGNADKKSVMSAIKKKYGIKFTNDNKADSYVLGLMAYTFLNYVGKKDFREEKEVIYKMMSSEKEDTEDKGEKKKEKMKMPRRKKLEF